MTITPENFAFVAELVRKESGISLSPDKGYLVDSRLLPLARERGYETVEALIRELRASPDTSLHASITDALTTNETSFFRDNKPFTHFREHALPRLLQKSTAPAPLRIWCAACSTGQEPYTLAMCLREDKVKLSTREVELIGTDISPTVIERARAARFSQFEVQRGMPIQLLLKYFTQEGEEWLLKEEIRRMVRFETFNLLHDYGKLGRLDCIFCRNVLIYFDKETRADILSRMHRLLHPHGLLYLGSSETVMGISDSFKPADGMPGVFEPV